MNDPLVRTSAFIVTAVDTVLCVTHISVTMENTIRQLREQKGWSQQELATAVGTSQQQIARIETGNQSVKLGLAVAICTALDSELGRVFPGTRRFLGRGKNRKDNSGLAKLRFDPKAISDFETAGVDLDPATWTPRLRLRGGGRFQFVCSAAEAQRIRLNLLEKDPSTSFVVFQSAVVAVAVNLDHLVHYHELWDVHTPNDWHDERIPATSVGVVLSDSPEVLEFEAASDEGTPDDEDDERQLRYLLFALETFQGDEEFLSFMDLDGEAAFFRVPDIALVTVPLHLLDARLEDALDEDEAETWDEEHCAEEDHSVSKPEASD